MGLSVEERSRLADIVELQPTSNGELGERWGLDDGSAVHGYLESHLSEYYYRDENSYIRATPDAAELVDVEPGIEETAEGDAETIRVPELERRVFAVLAGPDERSESVVSVLEKLREEFDVDPAAADVRGALRSLNRRGVVEVVHRTVPTFRLAVERDDVTVEGTG